MNRRSFLQSAGSALFAPAARRPNVVYILADQWRAQALGHRGDTNARTPAIDALARGSCSFSHAVSGFPVCSPYRASLMTGQYAARHGLVVNDVELRPNGPTVGDSFRKAGYATGYIGKWHIYGSRDGKYGRRLDYIPEASRFGFDYWKACECTHAYNKSLYYDGNDTSARYWDGYDAIDQTRDGCEFIRRHASKSDPYFLVVSLGPPHNPYGTAPDRYRALFENADVKLRPNVPRDKTDIALKSLRGYYAHMAALDDCVRQLGEAVDQSGAADDTVFIFTSDHGDMLQSQGLSQKQFPWDESIRVPFLVRYPKVTGSKRRTSITPVDAPDIMPTLLGLAGLKIPESVQGTDLSPLIRGERRDEKEPAALLNLPASFSEIRRAGIAEYRGVRTPRHTYVRSIHGPWLLYDNQTDPFQKRNLVTMKEHGAFRSHLDRRLGVMIKETSREVHTRAGFIECAYAR